MQTYVAFLRTFFSLFSAVMHESIEPYAAGMRKIRAYGAHTAHPRHARWGSKRRGKVGISVRALRKAQAVPSFSLPSLAPQPCDIPVYLGKNAKRRHFTEGNTAIPREKRTFE